MPFLKYVDNRISVWKSGFRFVYPSLVAFCQVIIRYLPSDDVHGEIWYGSDSAGIEINDVDAC